jgi:hypothetical protein
VIRFIGRLCPGRTSDTLLPLHSSEASGYPARSESGIRDSPRGLCVGQSQNRWPSRDAVPIDGQRGLTRPAIDVNTQDDDFAPANHSVSELVNELRTAAVIIKSLMLLRRQERTGATTLTNLCGSEVRVRGVRDDRVDLAVGERARNNGVMTLRVAGAGRARVYCHGLRCRLVAPAQERDRR